MKATALNAALTLGNQDLVEAFAAFGTVSEEEKKYAKDVEVYM